MGDLTSCVDAQRQHAYGIPRTIATFCWDEALVCLLYIEIGFLDGFAREAKLAFAAAFLVFILVLFRHPPKHRT
jgi:hypothetical protein